MKKLVVLWLILFAVSVPYASAAVSPSLSSALNGALASSTVGSSVKTFFRAVVTELDAHDRRITALEQSQAPPTTTTVTTTVTQPQPPPPSPPPATPVKTIWTAEDCLCPIPGDDLTRYRFVFLQPWHHSAIDKRTGTKFLAYKDMASTRNGGPGVACQEGNPSTTGVRYSEAAPSWFLLDTNGQRIQWEPWPNCWQMDVGNLAYQERWVSNVLAELRANGWDGVTIDNANLTTLYFPNQTPAKYPTQQSFQAATRSFLAYVGPRLKAAGFLVLPNIQAHPGLASADLWDDWTQFTSGGVQQYFTRWGCSGCYFDASLWNWTQSLFERMQARGRIFLTGGPEETLPRDLRLNRASFLVGWNGSSDAAVGCGRFSATCSFEIGRPTELRRLYAPLVHGRRYDGGLALVNVGTAAQQVSLGGTYRHPDGFLTSAVTLQPQHGLVLRTP